MVIECLEQVREVVVTVLAVAPLSTFTLLLFQTLVLQVAHLRVVGGLEDELLAAITGRDAPRTVVTYYHCLSAPFLTGDSEVWWWDCLGIHLLDFPQAPGTAAYIVNSISPCPGPSI
jgi:hypothetical protein